MILGILTLLTALCISGIAAYYSIVGLTAIFAAAVLPIIVMGAALELGKVVSTLWLHYNWDRAELKIKSYLVIAVIIIMGITSMGIFGFLSKAHLDQAMPSGDIQAQVQLFDEKIKTQRDNIESSRKALVQMDNSVDQLLARTTDDTGATKSANLRRSQAKERAKMQQDIDISQKQITKLQEERAPVASQYRKVEAEVGPIKYIAAVIYGDKADQNMLEAAVRWVIIIIVLVFDPLAIVLILAATSSLDWAKTARAAKKAEKAAAAKMLADIPAPIEARIKELEPQVEEPTPEPGFDTKNLQADFDAAATMPEPWVTPTVIAAPEPVTEMTDEEIKKLHNMDEYWEPLPDPVELPLEPAPAPVTEIDHSDKADDQWDRQVAAALERAAAECAKREETEAALVTLNNNFVLLETKAQALERSLAAAKELDASPGIADLADQNARLQSQLTDRATEIKLMTDTINRLSRLNTTAGPVTARPAAAVGAAPAMPDLLPPTPHANFGTAFPPNPALGDLHLRVDYLPSKLFKWVGDRWIEVDRDTTDTFAYDEEYIKLLINKVSSGEYDIDELNATEQEQIAAYLSKTKGPE